MNGETLVLFSLAWRKLSIQFQSTTTLKKQEIGEFFSWGDHPKRKDLRGPLLLVLCNETAKLDTLQRNLPVNSAIYTPAERASSQFSVSHSAI